MPLALQLRNDRKYNKIRGKKMLAFISFLSHPLFFYLPFAHFTSKGQDWLTGSNVTVYSLTNKEGQGETWEMQGHPRQEHLRHETQANRRNCIQSEGQYNFPTETRLPLRPWQKDNLQDRIHCLTRLPRVETFAWSGIIASLPSGLQTRKALEEERTSPRQTRQNSWSSWR